MKYQAIMRSSDLLTQELHMTEYLTLLNQIKEPKMKTSTILKMLIMEIDEQRGQVKKALEVTKDENDILILLAEGNTLQRIQRCLMNCMPIVEGNDQ